jgi:hypothetical protein
MEMEPEIVAGTALSFLQACYRNPSLNLTTRARIAIACLPFEVPRLAVTAQVSENSFAELLERRLARIKEMKLIETPSTNGNVQEFEPDLKPKPVLPNPLNRVFSSRFRRRV